ncbi:MAG: glycine cleavage system aminomethyltransferase GcvT [Thermoplasmata archaeon]
MTDPGSPAPLQRTALHPFHVARGAHLVPFAGWEMPLYYSSILAEHRAVRTGVGLFDVSHMGLVTVDGASAPGLLSRRTTANVGRLRPGQVKYTFALESTGHIIDDLLISRLDDGGDSGPRFLVVPNASHTAEVTEILRQHRRPDTRIALWNPQVSILAVQGPRAPALLRELYGWDLDPIPFYHARYFPDGAAPGRAGRIGATIPDDLTHGLLVSRTGYTGERGFELFVDARRAVAEAERLVAAGATPAGLGARDTLRLEKGYLLSGQEFHRDRTPIEAGQERFVEFDHPFFGRSVLEQQAAATDGERLAGLVVETPGAVPRHGTPVRQGDRPAGIVTSGGLSPSLGYGIALAYLPRALTEPGTELTLELRGRAVPAKVVRLPFLKNPPAPRA